MDQLSAHLDRGWELVQRGETLAAEVSARRALELDSDAPEAHNLLGFVAALREDYDVAREHYQKAVALDDTYMEAILNEAELCVHTLEEFHAAVELCDDALELAEDATERAETLLLKFDALLGLGDREGATQLAIRLPRGPFDDAFLTFLVGRALFEVEQWDAAREMLDKTLATNPESPDAHYYMGLWYEHRGQGAEAARHFVECSRLDSQGPLPPWSMEWDSFLELVTDALTRVEEKHQQRLSAAEVFVVDSPGAEVIAEGVDPRAFLLLDDDPADTEDDRAPLRLFVYKRSLERAVRSRDDLADELASALTQELDELTSKSSTKEA